MQASGADSTNVLKALSILKETDHLEPIRKVRGSLINSYVDVKVVG